jgi:glutaredoxin
MSKGKSSCNPTIEWVLIGRSSCPYTVAALALLKPYKHTYIDLTPYGSHYERNLMLYKKSCYPGLLPQGWATVPQIFRYGVFIGGKDSLVEWFKTDTHIKSKPIIPIKVKHSVAAVSPEPALQRMSFMQDTPRITDLDWSTTTTTKLNQTRLRSDIRRYRSYYLPNLTTPTDIRDVGVEYISDAESGSTSESESLD